MHAAGGKQHGVRHNALKPAGALVEQDAANTAAVAHGKAQQAMVWTKAEVPAGFITQQPAVQRVHDLVPAEALRPHGAQLLCGIFREVNPRQPGAAVIDGRLRGGERYLLPAFGQPQSRRNPSGAAAND